MSDRLLVFNPNRGGARLRLRDGRTATWPPEVDVRAIPARDARDAVRFGGMHLAEPVPVAAARLGLTSDEVLAAEPRLAIYTPKGGEPQQVVVLDNATSWRLRIAAAADNAEAALTTFADTYEGAHLPDEPPPADPTIDRET